MSIVPVGHQVAQVLVELRHHAGPTGGIIVASDPQTPLAGRLRRSQTGFHKSTQERQQALKIGIRQRMQRRHRRIGGVDELSNSGMTGVGQVILAFAGRRQQSELSRPAPAVPPEGPDWCTRHAHCRRAAETGSGSKILAAISQPYHCPYGMPNCSAAWSMAGP